MTSELRKELPPLPDRMKGLPVVRGYPVPWFVAWVDGVPDFRIADGRRVLDAIAQSRCWLCGEHLGRFRTYVTGPLGLLNNVAGEPPSHLECARFAVMACPFLVRPHSQRRDDRMPDGLREGPGEPILTNPGVTMVWTSRDGSLFQDGAGRPMWRMGRPIRVEWVKEGRAATRPEVLSSIEAGRAEYEAKGMPAAFIDTALAKLDRLLPSAAA